MRGGGLRATAGMALAALIACRSSSPRPPPDASRPSPEAAAADVHDDLEAPDAEPSPSDAATPAPPAPPRPSERWKKVVLVGDSMVGFQFGLSVALEKRFAAEKVKFASHAWTSEGIQTLSEDDKLETALAYERPNAVFLSLGTNNMAAPFPDAYAGRIRKIAHQAGAHGRDCYWISPPPPSWRWNPEILRVLRENSAPCVFFDSSGLELERQSDRIHPTNQGGEVWAAAIWEFLLTEARAVQGK